MKPQTITSLLSILAQIVLAAVAMAVPAGAQQFSDWSAPVNLGPAINSAGVDRHPAVSKDGLSLYFASDRPGGCGGQDIWVTQRASVDDAWETPFNLGCNLNSSANDVAPNLSTDGHQLFFHSFRAGGCGGGDIYLAHRKNRRDDLGWEPPVNLNRVGRDPQGSLICGGIGDLNLVNTPNTDAGPNHFQDEASGVTVLYFTRSDQPTEVGDFDIYVATLAADGTWGMLSRDDQLSLVGFRDTRTAIRRRDGLEMILSSERPSPLDSRDLWVSTRASTQDWWSIPILLFNISSTASDGGPALSWDGTELYFTSARAGGVGGNDLWVTRRAKIAGPQ